MLTLLFSTVIGQAGSGGKSSHATLGISCSPKSRESHRRNYSCSFVPELQQRCAGPKRSHPHYCHMDNLLIGCYTPPVPWGGAAEEQSPFRRGMYEPWGECAVKCNKESTCNIVCTGFSPFPHSEVTTPSLAETRC